MKNDELFFNYYNRVSCKIYVLGSSSEGESIIFVLYGDNKIIYSCITDSFLYQNQPAVKSILDDAGIKQITDLFWTHPHDDHSMGLIDIIDQFRPKHVFIPAELQNLPENTAEISRNVLHKLNQYRSCDKRFSYQPVIQGIGSNYIIKEEKIRVGTCQIPFEILAISPCLGRIRRKALMQDYNALNDYSVAVSIVVGDFSLLLTGDIQNQMLQYLSEDLTRKVPAPNILKIPHHGSKYSLGILSLFEEEPQLDIAVTTAKRSSKLPKQEALERYRTFSKHVYKVDDKTSDLAIWGVEVDILKAEITQIAEENYIVV